MHHKLTPVKKSGSGGWIYKAKFSNKFVAGPYTEISSRRVIYTCDYRRCQIGCPCMICDNDEVTKDKKPYLKIMRDIIMRRMEPVNFVFKFSVFSLLSTFLGL